MSYQVLARKWRPRNFSEMVGQEHVVRALSNALDNDRLHHAYLFTGTRGVGKTTLARILSKSLNCEQGVGASPCGVCSVCREIDEGRFVDLLEVDAASKTGVDDTRELLENVPYAPVRGRYKVYLIDEVHMFSGHSFNALLKTLEEPPPHVKFLLATTDPQKVPVTVLSRCLQFNLKRLPVDQIDGQLRHILTAEGVEFDNDALRVLARAADGSMRDGLSLLDQAIAFGGGKVDSADVRSMLGVVATERLPVMIAASHRGDASTVMNEIAAMAEHAPDFPGLLRDVVMLLHRLAVLQQVPDIDQQNWQDDIGLSELAAAISPEDVQLYYQIALHGQRDLSLAPDERSGFEMVMLRMLAFRPATGAMADSADSADSALSAAKPYPASRPVADSVVGVAEPTERESTEALPARTEARDHDDIAPQDWNDFVRRLELKGMAAQLAQNSVMEDWDGRSLRLLVDPACSSLIGTLAEQRLQESLSQAMGKDVMLDLTARAVTAETPARQEAREQQVRQEATEADIAADPVVLAVQEAFDAEIVTDSIRRID
jgi:DNA polymerase-3 subunit gamma/tau